MPTDMVIGDAINFDELKQALSEAPDLTTKFVKSEMFRFARRVRRRTIQQMTGAKARGPEAKSPGAALFRSSLPRSLRTLTRRRARSNNNGCSRPSATHSARWAGSLMARTANSMPASAASSA